MGYVHYWYRKPHLPPAAFTAFLADARKIIDVSVELGIQLANWDGIGEPTLTDQELNFNGRTSCGHAERDLGITWPAPDASGIGSASDAGTAGSWFAGAQLSTRVCGGDCSHENMRIRVREHQPAWWQRAERRGQDGPPPSYIFAFCKTAYKPYDVTVTAILIAAVHHFGRYFLVSSDGEDSQWEDGRMLAEVACGYGRDYHIGERYLTQVPVQAAEPPRR